MKTHALINTFMILDPALACTEMPVSPSLYQDLDAQFDGFKSCVLISEYQFEEDWDTWEMHPKGDEVLYLLEGEATLCFFQDGKEQRLPFSTPGSAVKVPAGTWHTARTSTPCRILFITPGEGTLNAPAPQG